MAEIPIAERLEAGMSGRDLRLDAQLYTALCPIDHPYGEHKPGTIRQRTRRQ